MERLVDDDTLLSHLDPNELVVFEYLPTGAIGFLCQCHCFLLVCDQVECFPFHDIFYRLSIYRVVHQFEEIFLGWVVCMFCSHLSIEVDVVIEDLLAFELHPAVYLCTIRTILIIRYYCN